MKVSLEQEWATLRLAYLLAALDGNVSDGAFGEEPFIREKMARDIGR